MKRLKENLMDNLINIYGKDIYFVNLKMKSEIIAMNKSYETFYAKKYYFKKNQ